MPKQGIYFWNTHKRTILAIVFVFLYSASISFATPPSTKYQPGQTLNPDCAPGENNCSVQILPEQAGNADRFLTTDGNVTSWSDQRLVLGGDLTTSGAYAMTLTATGTTTLTLPTSGTLINVADSHAYSDSAASSSVNAAVNGSVSYIPKFLGTHVIGNSNIYDDGANVGIGTTNPTQVLSVNGNIEIKGNSGNRYILTDETNTGSTKLTMQAGSGSAGFGGAINLYSQAYTLKPGWVTVGVGQGAGTAGTAAEGRFTVNDSALGAGTDVFTVLRTGNVGIGTTSPLGKLHVQTSSTGVAPSNVADDLVVENSSNAGISILGGNTSSSYLLFGDNDLNNAAVIQYLHSDPSLRIRTLEASAYLTLSTNNTERLRVDASGNVSIANLAGSGSRCVYADSSGRLNVKVSDCGTSSGGDDMGNHIASQNIRLSGFWLSNDGGNEGLRVTDAGNVAVGTGTTSAKFEVNRGGVNGVGILNLSGGTAYSTISWGRTTAEASLATAQGNNQFFTGAVAGDTWFGSTNGTIGIGNDTTGISTLTIKGGNVGIGNTAPGDLLSINSAAATQALIRMSVGGQVYSYYGVAGSTDNIIAGSVLGDTVVRTGGNSILFSTDSGTTANVYIKNGGNVGIGTTTPQRLLDVTSATDSSIAITSAITGQSSLWFADTDTNIGGIFYTHTNDQMEFRVNDATRMAINSSGSVGIGTASPQAPLHVGVDSSTVPGLLIGGGTSTTNFVGIAGNRAMFGYDDNSNLALTAGSGKGMEFFVNSSTGFLGGTQAMYIDNTGKVGIGTTSPGNKLQVVGSTGTDITNVQAGAGIFVTNGGSTGVALGSDGNVNRPVIQAVGAGAALNLLINPYGGNVGIGTTSPSGELHVKAASGFSEIYVQGASSTSGMYAFDNGTESGLWKVDNGYMAFGTNNAERIRILAGGDVGIGTTSAGYRLDVQKSGNTYVHVKNTSGNTTAGFLSENTTSHWFAGLAYSAAGGKYEITDVNAGAARLTIDTSGNVGIGTTNPLGMLDVTGGAPRLAINQRTNTGAVESGIDFYRTYDTGGNDQLAAFVRLLRAGGTSNTGLQFGVANQGVTPAAQMTLTPAGNIGIGAPIPAAKLHISGGDGTAGGIVIGNSSWPNNFYAGIGGVVEDGGNNTLGRMTFSTRRVRTDADLTLAMTILANGNVSIANLGTGALYSNGGTLTNTNPSDRRLKNTITDLGYGLEQIRQLQPKTYYYNDDEQHERLQYGFVAQDVQSVMPELVRPLNDGTDHLGLEINGIYVAAIRAIQELDIRVQALPEFEDPTLASKVAEFLRGIAERGEAVVDSILTKQVTTDTLCVGTENDKTCITKDQLDSLLSGQGGNSYTPPEEPSGDEEVTPPEDDGETPPEDEVIPPAEPEEPETPPEETPEPPADEGITP